MATVRADYRACASTCMPVSTAANSVRVARTAFSNIGIENAIGVQNEHAMEEEEEEAVLTLPRDVLWAVLQVR